MCVRTELTPVSPNGFYGACLVCFLIGVRCTFLGEKVQKATVPFTRANTADLPALESLVRASLGAGTGTGGRVASRRRRRAENAPGTVGTGVCGRGVKGLEMYNYSAVTVTALHAAGWTENRHFDTAHYEELLHEEGYTTFPAVLTFLNKYGGLEIAFPMWRFPGYKDFFHFEVDKILPRIFTSTIDLYAEDIGTLLCPIGDVSDGSATMVMDPSGAVYLAVEGLHDLGTSGEDAIEALCTNRPVKGLADDHI